MNPENTIVVEVENLTKVINGETILDNINLMVTSGEIVQLIGHNGSGKTMLLRSLCGLIRPSSGQVRVFDKAIGNGNEFPENVGAIIEHPGFLPQYSGRRNLELLASIRGKIKAERIDEIMLQVGLDPRSRKPVHTYSLGMKQRLGIAQAVMEYPKLVLLDEPTSTLDGDGIRMLHDMLLQLQGIGVTTILTSHQNNMVAQLSTQVYYLDRGRLLTHLATQSIESADRTILPG